MLKIISSHGNQCLFYFITVLSSMLHGVRPSVRLSQFLGGLC